MAYWCLSQEQNSKMTSNQFMMMLKFNSKTNFRKVWSDEIKKYIFYFVTSEFQQIQESGKVYSIKKSL